MKISNSKKQLAKIIHENGGWREGNYAVQDKDDKKVWFMFQTVGKPSGRKCWPGLKSRGILCDKVLPHWHQTILSRDEHFHLYPEPDADGWIEWKGGECPVGEGDRIDVKFSDGDTLFDVDGDWDWGEDAGGCSVIAYRLHKTEIAPDDKEPNHMPAPESKPAIEQLAADYRNAKDYADRKQQEADAAKADAEVKLAELVAAGKALGLVLSVADVAPELVLSVAGVQNYTGKFYNAELKKAPAYSENTRDAVCDGCGKRYGEHYGDLCKSGGER